MTDDEAKELRARLEAHYGERVAPVSEYCNAVDAYLKHAEAYLKEQHPGLDFFRLRHLTIGKSSFLDRLLYGGEKLRTEPCPVHKGNWSGIPFKEEPCGCDLTGWLRAK